jgi:hypothetical protein
MARKFNRSKKHSRKHRSKNRSKNRSKHNNNHKKNQKNKSNKKQYRSYSKNQKGGSSCSLATVQEPGFTIPALGDVPGLNISQAKGVIYRPNCKTDSNQAMIPT